jgi:hypothetical protein
MSLAKDLDIAQNQRWDDIVLPPSDLWSDEPPLESDLHLRQLILFLQSLEHCGAIVLTFMLPVI